MEEMQKAFNKTIIKLQNTSRIAEEQVSNKRAQILDQTERHTYFCLTLRQLSYLLKQHLKISDRMATDVNLELILLVFSSEYNLLYCIELRKK